jgi:hypothetical protein
MSSDLSGYLASALSLIFSGALSLVGAILLRKNHASVGSSKRELNYFVLGTTLILSGVWLIIASNLASFYVLSDVGVTISVDVGSTISACGCVISAYSFLKVR